MLAWNEVATAWHSRTDGRWWVERVSDGALLVVGPAAPRLFDRGHVDLLGRPLWRSADVEWVTPVPGARGEHRRIVVGGDVVDLEVTAVGVQVDGHDAVVVEVAELVPATTRRARERMAAVAGSVRNDLLPGLRRVRSGLDGATCPECEDLTADLFDLERRCLLLLEELVD